MKTIKYWPSILRTLTISCLLMITSCEKFLTEDPISDFTAGTYFKDAETLQAGVVGMYSALVNQYVINTNTPFFMTLVGTDEVQYRAANTNIRSTIDRYGYTPTEECLRECWGRHYVVISRANTVIDKGALIEDIDESVRARLTANARFARAWSYFQLVQIFGAVPLNTRHLETYDFGVPRSPVKDVYAQIIEDLEYCIADGILPTEITDGFANQWGAKALLGKVYLTMASAKIANKVEGYADITTTSHDLYQAAYDILDDIITNSGRSLLPVYGDAFKIENKNTNAESLWEVQFSLVEPYGTQWSKELGCPHSGYSGTAGGWRFSALAGSYSLNYVPTFRNYYDANGYDIRRDWNLKDSVIVFDKTTGQPLSIKGFDQLSTHPVPGDITNRYTCTYSGVTKYRWGDRWDEMNTMNYANLPNNIIALRYADVLLMFAEADLGLHGTATQAGLDAINLVRQRARGFDSEGMPVSPENTPGFDDYTASTLDINEILMERARELCFERWRWFDLARTGTFEQFLAARNAIDSYIPTNFQSDRHYVFPIPQKEIDISTNKEGMYQNPNY